jgi:hypothetical protein
MKHDRSPIQEKQMDNQTPFDKAKKQCSEFAWNFLSSLQMLKIKEKLEETKEEISDESQLLFDNFLENHCKHLTNEVQQ